jgi:rubrerythrin
MPDPAPHESPTLADVDCDGAVREAAEAVEADTRAAFLRKSGLLAGTGLGLAALPAGFALAQGTPKSDVKILNYALTLEYLEAAFYEEAIRRGRLDGVIAQFAQVVGAHENAHVEALRAALGSAATKKPRFDFKDTTASEEAFVRTAVTLEDTGVAAYQGQADKIKTTEILASAGAILAVEARHAAWIRDIIGAGQSPSPAPAAFSEPMSLQQVLDAVEQTGFIKS